MPIDTDRVHTPAGPRLGALSERVLAAARWSYLGVAALVLSTFIAQIVLARLLGPVPFGMFGICMLTVGMAAIFSEMGLGSALIQKRTLTEADIRVAFTRVVAASAGLALLLALVAPLLAQFFGDSALIWPLRGIALSIVIASFSVVPLSLLKRRLEMRTVHIARVASYITGFVLVGIGLALAGAGVWSLVGAMVAQCLTEAVLVYRAAPYTLRPLLVAEDRALQGFAGRVMLTNLSNWASENVDNLLVGKLLGVQALGYYSVSYNLVRTPTNHLVGTLQQVLFSASARMQDDAAALGRAYLLTLNAVLLVSLPTFIAAGVLSETLVVALYGQKWLAAAPVILPLALAMPVHAAMAIAGPTLAGRGMVGKELKVQFWVALLLIAAIFVSARFSLEALAWSVFGVCLVRAVWMTAVLIRVLGVPAQAALAPLRGTLPFSLAVAGTLFAADHGLQVLGILAPLRLIFALALGAALALGGGLLCVRFLVGPDLAKLLLHYANEETGRLPRWFTRYLIARLT